MKLLFDIGGTKFRVGFCKDDHSINSTEIFDTPQNYKQGLDLIKRIIERNKKTDVDTVSAGIAGMFDIQKEKLIHSPNLPDWERKEIKKDICSSGVNNVFLENDALTAGLGEAVFGAGRNYKIIAYLTIGTGIGGVRIVEKKADEKTYGFEPGHMIIDKDKMLDLESLTSGSGLKKQYGISAQHIKDSSVWDEVEKNLSIGVYNMLLLWSPEIVIFGGGLIEENAINIERIRKKTEVINKVLPQIPEFRKSQLLEKAGLFGALCLK